MKPFPLRLAAGLALTRAAGSLRLSGSNSSITFVDPAEVLHRGSTHPVLHEKFHALVSSPAALVWIRGSEPLDHPGIAHLVRAVLNSRRFVFLETSAVRLRLRIHEFQPRPNFFLLVRLDSTPPAPDKSPLSPGPHTLALEGIRAAQLSGFFVAAHTAIHTKAGAAGLKAVASIVEQRGLDGWIITAGARDEALQRRATAARTLISSAGWRRFSARVEPELSAHSVSTESLPLPPEPPPLGEVCEESAKVS